MITLDNELIEKLEDSGKVRSIELLRADIKNYNRLKNELYHCECEYAQEVAKFKEKIMKAEEELSKIKSPGYGDGFGGYVEHPESKMNKLIEEKEMAQQELQVFMSANNLRYYNRKWVLMSRISAVEKVLKEMNEKDKEFINDLYIEQIGLKKVMKKYEIENNGDVYRKGKNILLKIM